MLPWIQHRWTGLCLLVAALATLMLFLYGFFPLKYHSGRMSHMDDLPNFIEGVRLVLKTLSIFALHIPYKMYNTDNKKTNKNLTKNIPNLNLTVLMASKFIVLVRTVLSSW